MNLHDLLWSTISYTGAILSRDKEANSLQGV